MKHLRRSLLRIRQFSTGNNNNGKIEELNEKLFKKYFEDVKQKQPPYYDAREIGPYPVVPPILYQFRPPVKYHSNEYLTQTRPSATHYFDPFLRRQFGEPLPEHFELWTVQAPEIEPHYSPAFMLSCLVASAGVLYAWWYFCQYMDPHPESRLPYKSLETPSMKSYLSPSAYSEYKRAPQ